MFLNFWRPPALRQASPVRRNRMSHRVARAPFSRDVPPSARAPPMQFALASNRSGMFTVELTATDHVAGQSVIQGKDKTNINKPGQPV